MRRALQGYDEIEPHTALRMLGLEELNFLNEEEALKVLRKELVRMVRKYDREVKRADEQEQDEVMAAYLPRPAEIPDDEESE